MDHVDRLVQKRIGEQVTFTLEGVSRLIVENRNLFRTVETPIALELIDPEPVTYRKVPVGPSIWFALGLLLAIGLFLNSIFESNEASVSAQRGLSMFSILIAAIAFAFLYQGYANVYIFKNANNGMNLIVINRRNPSEAAVALFVAELSKKIQSIKYPETMPIEKKLEIYRAHLEFLRRESVLSEQSYQEAINNLEARTKGASVIRIV